MTRSPESDISHSSSTPDLLACGPFDVDVDVDGRAAQVTPAGELDIASAPALCRALEELADSDVRQVILDLRRLTFIDSSGLRVILQADGNARANGHDLHVVRGLPIVQRVFELTRMHERLNMLDAPQDAPDPLGELPGSQRG